MPRIIAPMLISYWHPASSNGWTGLRPPNPSRFSTGKRFAPRPTAPIPLAQINLGTLQPWQQHAAKLAFRREHHRSWDARRIAREERKALNSKQEG